MYVDLDEFKNVNDTLGHHVGDLLLVAVSNRLQSTLRDADTIGRMGGDEFVVLIDGASRNAVPELVADRLLEVMRQPFVLDGATMPLMVNTSIGIAVGDRSLARETCCGTPTWRSTRPRPPARTATRSSTPRCMSMIQQRIELEFDLRSALVAEQFHLVYQPIYNLDDLTIVGRGGLAALASTPPVGSSNPTSSSRSSNRPARSARSAAGWYAKPVHRWRFGTAEVTLSTSRSTSRAVSSTTTPSSSTSPMPSRPVVSNASSLIIEITETALMRRAEATARRLQAIKDLGVRIAVDNFGTGYSSLAYLQQFPVDCLKIDRSFTSAITTSPESKALVGTLVQLGKDLGLKTLAEGVETTGQMDHLRGEHVNEAQGYPLRPAPRPRRARSPTPRTHPTRSGEHWRGWV